MSKSKVTDWIKAPIWLMGVAGSEKSFRKNLIIGNPHLNEKGLHRARVRIAARLAEKRRLSLSRMIDPADRAAFDRDGYVLKPDALPRDVFERLRDAFTSIPLPAREMRQGQTVTRMIPLGPGVVAKIPDVAAMTRSAAIDNLLRYVAGGGGDPVYFVQTVIAEPEKGPIDPQTEMHADTFHSTAKAWLFLQDVGEDDGPFMFVPGSHRLTPERLDWEYRMSLTASTQSESHHSHGSFRIRPDDLTKLGDFAPRRVTVAANTLVVADTFAFHSRTPSPKPTLRMEIHGYLRRNPFLPWASTLPSPHFIKDRRLDLFLAHKDRMERWGEGRHVWREVGLCTANAPPHV